MSNEKITVDELIIVDLSRQVVILKEELKKEKERSEMYRKWWNKDTEENDILKTQIATLTKEPKL